MAAPIPEGFHTVNPYLIVDDAKAAIDFYVRAFGATEVSRLPMGDKIGHAELKLGDSHIMLADEFPEAGHLGPKTRGGPTSSLVVYVDDVDSAFGQALAAGAKEQRPVEDQFWGDRMGTLSDPFGHQWSLATHMEDVPPEQYAARMKAWGERQKQGEPA